MRKLLRILRGVSYESREGRAAEIVGWSNAIAALAVGGAVWWATSGLFVYAAVSALALFIVLRVALAHRVTVWIAASLGSTVVGASAGALAWTFGHIVEHPLAPPIAAIVFGLGATLVPALAYASIAKHRANDIPDSLVDPPRTSRPSSG